MLALWVHNLAEGVTLDDVVIPLAITVGATGLVMAGATMLLRRDLRRGALAAAATVFLVFSFGPVFFLLGGVRVAGVAIAPAPGIVALCVARLRQPTVLGRPRATWVLRPRPPTTNYPHTSYFLASALNLQNVQDLVPPGTALGVGTLRSLITDDVVPKFLKAKGYRYVHIGS